VQGNTVDFALSLTGYVDKDGTDDGGIDQDFDFIEDDIASLMTDMQQKEPALSYVRKAIEKGKRKIPE